MSETNVDVQQEIEQYLDDSERRFVVTDDRSAEWVLDKIREAEKEKEFWKNYYDEQYSKVEKACDFKIAWMERLLKPYFDQVPKKQTKTQSSYQLPGGKLIMKRYAPTCERDDAQLLLWLSQNNGEKYVKMKESVDWAELKKILTPIGDRMTTEDGEVVPGIVLVERPDEFKVEVS